MSAGDDAAGAAANRTAGANRTRFFPCKGTFMPGDADIGGGNQSSYYTTGAPPLFRMFILADVNGWRETLQTLLTTYSLLVLAALACSVAVRVLVARSGLQSTVAWLLELGNRCGVNLLRRRLVCLGMCVGVLECALQLPHIFVLVAAVHLVAVTGWIWVGLLTASFGLGITCIATASVTALGSQCRCGPRQHASIAFQLATGVTCILISWVVQVTTLMRGFYSATAMALTLSAIPLIIAVYLTAGESESHHFATILGTHLFSHSWRSNLADMATSEAHRVFGRGRVGNEGEDGEEEDDEDEEKEEEENADDEDDKEEDGDDADAVVVTDRRGSEYIQKNVVLSALDVPEEKGTEFPSANPASTRKFAVRVGLGKGTRPRPTGPANRNGSDAPAAVVPIADSMSAFSAFSSLITPGLYRPAETTVNYTDQATGTYSSVSSQNSFASADGEAASSTEPDPAALKSALADIRQQQQQDQPPVCGESCAALLAHTWGACACGREGATSSALSASSPSSSPSSSSAHRRPTNTKSWMRRLRVGMITVLYLSSASIMLGYSALLSHSATPGWEMFGFYASLMTLVLDIPALAAFSIGVVGSPGASAILLVANRCLILVANGGTVMAAETICFLGYGLLFVMSDVDHRMGVLNRAGLLFGGGLAAEREHVAHRKRRRRQNQRGRRKRASGEDGEDLGGEDGTEGDNADSARPHRGWANSSWCWSLFTPQEAVLVFLLLAYTASFAVKQSTGMLSDMSGCDMGPASDEAARRPLLLWGGIVVVPLAGVMRAATWMLHVDRRHGTRTMVVRQRAGTLRTPDAASPGGAASAAAAGGENSEGDAWGKYLHGVALATIAQMLLTVALLALNVSYPSHIGVDLELTIFFAWPTFLCGRAGIQRWVLLDFPESDSHVWAYFGALDAFLIAYAITTTVLGSPHQYGPLVALFVVEIMGAFIPLAEMGGRALDRFADLSKFARSWLVAGVLAHLGAHILVIAVVAPPLTSDLEDAPFVLGSFGEDGHRYNEGSGPDGKLSAFLWVVILTGTFSMIPVALVIVLMVVRIMDSSSVRHSNVETGMPVSTTAARSISTLIEVAANSQIVVVLWLILLCCYHPTAGLWTVAIYLVVVCAVCLVGTLIDPTLANDPDVSFFCGRRARRAITAIMALVPLVPLVIQIMVSVHSSSEPSSSSSGLSVAGETSTSSSETMHFVDDGVYNAIMSAAAAVNLMHWIWGRGLFAVLQLVRQDSHIWCTPTIFPVYDWDPSLGEHGQLREVNSGLTHAFAAFGEIVLACLAGVVFARPERYSMLVATSNFFIVFAVVCVMELAARPILNYVEAAHRLRNAMLLTANQTQQSSAGLAAAEGMFASTLRWAWLSAAEVELRSQDHEQLGLVAHRHSLLRNLMRRHAEEGASEVAGRHLYDAGTTTSCFVTSEGIQFAARRSLLAESQRRGTDGAAAAVLSTDPAPESQRQSCLQRFVLWFHSREVVSAATASLSSAPRRKPTLTSDHLRRDDAAASQGSGPGGVGYGEGNRVDEDGPPPPPGSAFWVKAEREKLLHLHSFKNKRKMKESSVPKAHSVRPPGSPSQLDEKTHDNGSRAYRQRGPSARDTFSEVVGSAAAEDAQVVPVFALVECVLLRDNGDECDPACPLGIVTVRGPDRVALDLVERQLGGAPDVWTESITAGVPTLLARRALFDGDNCPPARRLTAARVRGEEVNNDGVGAAEQEGIEITTLYRAFGKPAEMVDNRITWWLFLGDLSSDFDEWQAHSRNFLRRLRVLRQAVTGGETEEDDTEEDNDVEEVQMKAGAKGAGAGKDVDTVTLDIEDAVELRTPSSGAGGQSGALARTPQARSETSISVSSTPSPSSDMQQHSSSLSGMFEPSDTYSDVPSLERFFLSTACAEMRHEMHTRLLVAQASKHFVKRARKLYSAFLTWCCQPANCGTLRAHGCTWLTLRTVRLHRSGLKLFDPSTLLPLFSDETSVAQDRRRHMNHSARKQTGTAHVREICFAEVMRWSYFPEGTDLRTMYNRQRGVFALFCASKIDGEERLALAAERGIQLAEARELRREKAAVFRGAARNLLTKNRELLLSPHSGSRPASPFFLDGRKRLGSGVGSRVSLGLLGGGGGSTKTPGNGQRKQRRARRYKDYSFEGDRAIFENPVDPLSTPEGRELAAEISRVVPGVLPFSSSSSAPADGGGALVWARPREFMSSPVLTDGFSADDIEQGLLGDCWLLSAMSAVAHSHGHILEQYTLGIPRQERGSAGGTAPIRPDGRYDIRIHVDGEWKMITVDDRIPCVREEGSPDSSSITINPSSEGAQQTFLRPAFGRSSTHNELWVSLLEKAIAKHYGSYEAITGGLIHVAMSLLTGGIGQMVRLSQAKKLGHVANGRLWLKMYSLHREGHLLAAGSPPLPPSAADAGGGGGRRGGGHAQNAVTEMGIVRGHAYAILRLVQIRDMHGSHKLLQLRNPWGRPRGNIEWRGPWCDTDTVNWTQRMKSKVGFTGADQDGIFWMSFEDFVEHFHSLYICRLYVRDLELPTSRPEKGWRRYRCPGTWTRGGTAGGAPIRQHRRAARNPQFLLKPTRAHTSVFITLEQPSLYRAHHVCIFVAKVCMCVCVQVFPLARVLPVLCTHNSAGSF